MAIGTKAGSDVAAGGEAVVAGVAAPLGKSLVEAPLETLLEIPSELAMETPPEM
jgi:hypothetical protein